MEGTKTGGRRRGRNLALEGRLSNDDVGLLPFASTRRETAALLGISLTTLSRMVDAKKLPYMYVGGQLRFPTKRIIEMLENGEVA